MEHAKNFQSFTLDDGRKIILRTLQEEDLPALVEFAKTLFRERGTNPALGIVSIVRPVTRAEEMRFLTGILRGVKQKEAVSVAAFSEDKLVGNCDISRRKFYDVMHTGVLGIAIVDGYRNAGIGEKMIGYALREARRIGVWLVELQVFQTNHGAVHLYEKLGFRRIGVVPNKILRRGLYINEILMFVDLGGTRLTGRRRTVRS